jgi:hypothetical protein
MFEYRRFVSQINVVSFAIDGLGDAPAEVVDRKCWRMEEAPIALTWIGGDSAISK